MKKVLALGAMVVLGSLAAYGSTTCASGSSTNFGVSGGDNNTIDLSAVNTCTIGSITFSDFFVVAENSLVPTTFAPTATLINANTLSFTYSGLGSGADIQFGFKSTGGSVSSILLGGGGSTTTTEIICTVAFTGESCLGGSVLGGPTTVTNGGSATITLASNPSDVYYYSKDITGGSGVTQSFNIVPEPMTMSLMGVGLLGLGLVRRYRRKS